jgi:hypothetical protein
VRAHGRVRIKHTGAKSFGLTAENDERGGKSMCACEGGGLVHRHAKH